MRWRWHCTAEVMGAVKTEHVAHCNWFQVIDQGVLSFYIPLPFGILHFLCLQEEQVMYTCIEYTLVLKLMFALCVIIKQGDLFPKRNRRPTSQAKCSKICSSTFCILLLYLIPIIHNQFSLISITLFSIASMHFCTPPLFYNTVYSYHSTNRDFLYTLGVQHGSNVVR